MGAEYELKYRASSAIQNAIAEAFPGNWERICMQTTYYDTPSGALSARRYMLRMRRENGVSICTLKTPGKGKERGEWELPCEEITSAVSELCKLGAPADLVSLCAEGLIPICGAAFTRQARILQMPDFVAELALDSGSLFGNGRQIPLQEIELELKQGSRNALDTFAEAFSAKYGLAPEEESKFARALSLYKEV